MRIVNPWQVLKDTLLLLWWTIRYQGPPPPDALDIRDYRRYPLKDPEGDE